ncbi:MAG TPA: hypothetical protein VE783_05120 [Candidatus Limnocylindrales bacterium]|nr:hypothetical protein [Candidatus Limnocylindrales bacterium]
MRAILFYLLSAIVVVLVGCATPGPPLPPSRGIPAQITDLRAARKGDTVTLTWSIPRETTDGELIRKPGIMVISRAAGSGFQDISQITMPRALDEKRPEKANASDSLSNLLQQPASDFAVYQVTSLGAQGRKSGTSNQASVPLVRTAKPPASVQLSLSPDGVTISIDPGWRADLGNRLNSRYALRLMRTAEGSKERAKVAEVNPVNAAMAIVDRGIEWEKRYTYWITPVTYWEGEGQKGEVVGDDSPTSTILAHDTFPPAVPQGLQAVYSGLPDQPFIDMTWSPNTEPDLAGYDVYRLDSNGQWSRINTGLVKTPAFKDATVQPGHKYSYSVTAVDLRGNESARSEQTSESVPPKQ